MNVPISKATAPHYVWGGVCDGWRLANEPGLSVIEERVPARGTEKRHYHQHARQFFYILSGEATLEVEGVEHVLRPGFGLEVAPGARHCFKNKGAVDVTFLVISAPTTAGDRFES